MKKLPLTLVLIMMSAALEAQSLPFLLSRGTDMALAGSPAPYRESSLSIGRWAEEAEFADLRVRKDFTKDVFAGGTALCFRHGEYALSDSQGRETGEYRPRELSFGIFGGYKIKDGLRVTGSLKFAHSAFSGEKKASCVLADLFLDYSPVHNWKLCAALLNISSGTNYGSENLGAPTSLSLFAQRSFTRATVYSRADILFSAAPMASIGGSYALSGKVSAKAGAHIGKTIPPFISLGPCLRTGGGMEFTLAGLFAPQRHSFSIEVKVPFL